MVVNRKTALISAGFLIVVAIGAGLWWHEHPGAKHETMGAQTVGDHTISLDQTSSQDDSGGLNVSSGGASDLGQLNGNQSQGSGSSSSSGGSSSGGIDASTFVQYDKYKNNKSALFGDIKAGSGTTLTAGKKATVYYKGWLTNGTLIDQSSVSSSGQPQSFSFTMGKHEVIVGWEESMYGMKTGGTRMLIIPPAVGYGSQGKGAVPPNSVLVFEVQLLSVN